MRMTNMIRFFVFAVILFALFAHPKLASACSCVMPDAPAEEFAQSDAVFTGKVIRMVDNYFPVLATLDRILNGVGLQSYFFNRNGKYWGYSVYFAVRDSWKGITETIVEANTGYGGGDCGYSFVVGNDYLVYAHLGYGKPDGYWVTGNCSRNSELASATEDLTYLNTLPKLPLRPSLGLVGLLIGKFAPALTLTLIALAILSYVYEQRRASRLKTEQIRYIK